MEGDETLPADLVVMAVGIRPETRLATDAGLEVARGIEVNAQMQTSDPDIFAVGECVEFDGNLFGLVAPLYDQAKVLARTLMGEEDALSSRTRRPSSRSRAAICSVPVILPMVRAGRISFCVTLHAASTNGW